MPTSVLKDENEDDDEVTELKERLAAYNFDDPVGSAGNSFCVL